jgi:prefoldin subunit 4
VTREDQDNINRFSTLHQKQSLLKEELEAKLVSSSLPPSSPPVNTPQQEKEYLVDVTSELELADEDELVPYKIGDSFFHLPLEEVQELLEKSTAKIEEDIEEIEHKIDANRETMEALKVELYAKFGKAINLDV